MDDTPREEEREQPPIEELADFTEPVDPEFVGRVRRSLNRHLLLGDSLEFSFSVFQQTAWEYLKSAFEAMPARNSRGKME